MRPLRLPAIASFGFICGLTFASLGWATPEPPGIVLATLETAIPPSARDLQAKIEYCQICHQPSGQGVRGTPPIPRLAGQQTEYFVNQLRAFIERRRLHNIMFNVAHFLGPAMQRALAEHFRDLNPGPLGGAPKELAAAGKKIYEGGLLDAGVPPCAICHGPEPKETGYSRAWQVSSMNTSSASC